MVTRNTSNHTHERRTEMRTKRDYIVVGVWYHDMWSDGESWTSNDRQPVGIVTIPTDYTGSDVVKALRDHGYIAKRKHYTADDQYTGVVYVENAKGDEMIEVNIFQRPTF